MTDPNIESVLSNFSNMVASGGGSLKFLSFSGGILKVLYDAGKSDICTEEWCVLSPQHIENLLTESLRLHAPYVAKVEVIPKKENRP